MKLFAWYGKVSLIKLNIGAFILGCIAGLILWKVGTCGYESLVGHITDFLAPFGNILVLLLKMIVIPIVALSLVCGASSLPLREFGKMGIAVVIWYFLTSLYAAVFGSLIAICGNPSLNQAGALAGKMLARAGEMQAASAGGGASFSAMIYGLFMNPFQALATGQFLPTIVFAILFGLAIRTVMDSAKDAATVNSSRQLLTLLDAAQKAVFKIVDWVMRYFPVGVFALTAGCFATYGVSLLQSYFQVAICVITGILLMLLVCYPLMILLLCRENPYPVMWKLREPILTAFVTRSSAAALPVSIRTADEVLHVRRDFSGFTLSLGATVNMDGVCLHLPVFAVLASNLFGFDMGFSQILLMIIGVVFASVGAGGVPGGSIFLLFLVLEYFHLTPEQMSLVVALALGINPLLDMFETACNVAGDNVGTYVIGKKLHLLDNGR